MDQDRFDQITRTLALGQSRRGVLKGLIASALGGTLAAVGLAPAAAKPAKVGICHWDKGNGSYTYLEVSASAVPTHQKHGDVVTNLTDESNCGACGSACYEGLDCCNGTCTDPEAYQHDDSANCGWCGNACASGWVCFEGSCIDVRDDPENCGAVYHDCASEFYPDYYCEEGTCHKICGGERNCADGDCYYECHDPECGATEGNCGGFHEACCPDRDFVRCFGSDTCPPDTQRFIGVR